ncbi:MAG: glycosyltransferase family 4 protein [Rubrivivax sp.]|nr:glycosyltransferase family 4 protein [Pyrinomonadaceae bacterium]
MRLRLCFIVESGADVRLVEGLAERFELSIFAREIRGGVEISQETSARARVKVGPASRAGFAWAVLNELRAQRRGLDCVVVQGYGLAALAANVAGRALGLPVLMLVCSPVEKYYLCRKVHDDPAKPFRGRELLALRLLARANARLGQRYIVLSRHLAEVVRGHGARRSVEIVPIYGVDTQVFSPARAPKTATKERLGLPASGSLIFFSSRVAPEKDAETLLAAFRALLDAGQDLWLLHRSGGYREFLKAAEKFGVAARVVATDAVHPHEQLPEDYRAADICVQASREEGLGFSPLEALACGVPVVATDVGGLKETIVDGETGWSYPVGDAAALARCIVEALNDTEEAARRTANGRAMVCERYERRDTFKQLSNVIESCQETDLSRDLIEAP